MRPLNRYLNELIDYGGFPYTRAEAILDMQSLGMDQPCIGWARKLFEAMSPHAAGTVYVNFMPDDESDQVERAYGVNFSRLAEIKRRYDPSNLFRMNQNVKPSDRSPTFA